MAQSEFRVNPATGKKQKLNANRRWENVEDASTSPLSGTVSGSKSASLSDFSSYHNEKPDMTQEQRDAQQIGDASGFSEFLLEEGVNPYDISSSQEELDDYIAEYIEAKDLDSDVYESIINEVSSHEFSRVYNNLISDATQYEMNRYERLAEDAYSEAEHPVYMYNNTPDMYPDYLENVFEGDFAGTFDEYCMSEPYVDYDFQREGVKALVDEWRTRIEKDNEGMEYLHVSSPSTGWRGVPAQGVMSMDDFVSQLDRPAFVPNTNEYSVDWIQDKNGKDLTAIVSHHDRPTGESWTITPMSKEESDEIISDN